LATALKNWAKPWVNIDAEPARASVSIESNAAWTFSGQRLKWLRQCNSGRLGFARLDQINLVVPAWAPDGDNLITATYNAATIPARTLLTVQH
jgi:hypothetical protein